MTCDTNVDPVVASLLFQHASRPKRVVYEIRTNDEFDIGRRQVQQAWGIDELTVSTHHLRFHCIVFEDEDDDKVAPLIYVRVLSRNPVILKCSDSNNPGVETTLFRDSGDVLLNHGDILQLASDISLIFQTNRCGKLPTSGLDDIRQAEVRRFAAQYQVTGRMLGAGGNASVFVAVKQSSHRQVACKIVSLPCKRRDQPQIDQRLQVAEAEALELRLMRKRENLAREYNVLKDLNHPNIICLEQVFCASYNIYIFQELITGGDLLSYIEREGALGEPQTAVIVRQVLKATDYLHSNLIVHRDIKPENVLMTSWREGGRIVLTDFGQARTLEGAKTAAKSSAVFRMQSVVGTYGYTAPEVYQQPKRDLQRDNGYSKAIDIWSIGCITATLLTDDLIFPEDGERPPSDDAYATTHAPTMRWDLSILDHGVTWQGIGRHAKSFVRGCLKVDEAARLTAKQALLHEWFTNKHYAAELEAAYQRAIHDWKPRANAGNLIQFVDTTDAVPAEVRPGHVRRLVEETKSHHFPPSSVPKPPPNAFNKNLVYLPPPKTKHTPLPTVAEEVEDDATLAAHDIQADGVVGKRALFASPACIPNSPVADMRTTRHRFEHMSIEDFAPSETQYSVNDSLPPPPPDWNDSVTPSQLMLDEPSQRRYPSPPVPVSAYGTKRPTSWAGVDELDESLTQGTPYFADGAMAAQSQRKKVCR